jgi:hypothetical protein
MAAVSGGGLSYFMLLKRCEFEVKESQLETRYREKLLDQIGKNIEVFVRQAGNVDQESVFELHQVFEMVKELCASSRCQ